MQTNNTVTLPADTLATLCDGADTWIRELRDYVIPGDETDEERAGHEQQADTITEAIIEARTALLLGHFGANLQGETTSVVGRVCGTL